MTKLSSIKKKARTQTRSEHYPVPAGALREHVDSAFSEPGDLFLEMIRKAAGFERKDFEHGMSVSKTLVKAWFEGTRHSPLRRARDMVSFFRTEKKVWLIPPILEYIAGSDFDGAILTSEQQHALMVLAKGIK